MSPEWRRRYVVKDPKPGAKKVTETTQGYQVEARSVQGDGMRRTKGE